MIDATAHNDLEDRFEPLPKLYSRRSDGGVQVWWVEVSGSRHRAHSGIEGGAIVTSEWTQCKGKRKLTDEKQAESEATALHKKKSERDYHANVLDIDKPNFFAPMLAFEYGKKIKAVKAAFAGKEFVYAQPKLDGMRCIVTPYGMFSRNGKPVTSAPHILASVKAHFKGDFILDGELYNHELRADFDTLMSIARKATPDARELAISKQTLQYHVYDLPSYVGGFGARHATLAHTLPRVHPSLVLVETQHVHNEQGVQDVFDMWFKQGYEGAMIRLDRPYENKRCDALLKFKNFMDDEFEIQDVIEGVGNKAGMAGAMAFLTRTNLPFTAALMGNASIFKTYLAEKSRYIGKKATVKFQNYTPGGIPRFPCVKAIREDE